MLSLFLLILKIIGIILLVILVLIIMLLVLILFAPIKYKCEMSKHNKVCADIEIIWIFKLFKCYFKLGNNNSQGRIVFIPFEIINNIKKIKLYNIIKKKIKTKDNVKEKVNTNISKKNNKEEKINSDTYKKEIKEEKNSTSTNKEDIKKESKCSSTKEKVNIKAAENESLKDEDDVSVINNIKKIMSYKNKDEIIMLTVKLSKKLFKVLTPNKFKFVTVIGLDNPYDTACFIGFMNSIKIFIPLDIEVNGDFEKSNFDFYLNASGKANIFKVGLPIVIYILKKPIWNIITGNGKEVSDE